MVLRGWGDGDRGVGLLNNTVNISLEFEGWGGPNYPIETPSFLSFYIFVTFINKIPRKGPPDFTLNIQGHLISP